MKRWFTWLSPAPLWQYIPVTLAYCLVITDAAYVARLEVPEFGDIADDGRRFPGSVSGAWPA